MQLDMFTRQPDFDGPAYVRELDAERLTRQLDTIRAYMLTVGWVTLAEIHAATGYPESSISAQLRHLRKPRFGSYDVQKRRRSAGTYEYRVWRED